MSYCEGRYLEATGWNTDWIFSCWLANTDFLPQWKTFHCDVHHLNSLRAVASHGLAKHSQVRFVGVDRAPEQRKTSLRIRGCWWTPFSLTAIFLLSRELTLKVRGKSTTEEKTISQEKECLPHSVLVILLWGLYWEFYIHWSTSRTMFTECRTLSYEMTISSAV